MLWLKALHLIFMVTWFAGLFYLPRLFVYHCQVKDAENNERFKVMERKLFWAITTPGGVLTILFGLLLIHGYGLDWFRQQGWLHIKLAFVLLLIGYHIWCGKLLADFAADRNRRSERFYRAINEIPVLPLIAIILLAVLRPF
ncbi:protoporphyrinogen oxidase HemJ [Permianibacter sp. IMCC34836]|uniref:protoporphyrinogen oxidase HemJ n=1 Tax=Permianibacter fluminis TaxID=2738515 RepID=UPI0015579C47|nr:protoporphyrinogen oxidase HemJ [Permianibacter fluminis]NQD39105.1 protoporphyrinogen oxidase HemJ [Permianibacter fluminis]